MIQASESKALEFILKHLEDTGDTQVSRRAAYHLDQIAQARLDGDAQDLAQDLEPAVELPEDDEE